MQGTPRQQPQWTKGQSPPSYTLRLPCNSKERGRSPPSITTADYPVKLMLCNDCTSVNLEDVMNWPKSNWPFSNCAVLLVNTVASASQRKVWAPCHHHLSFLSRWHFTMKASLRPSLPDTWPFINSPQQSYFLYLGGGGSSSFCLQASTQYFAFKFHSQDRCNETAEPANPVMHQVMWRSLNQWYFLGLMLQSAGPNIYFYLINLMMEPLWYF